MSKDALSSRKKIVDLLSRAMVGPTGPEDSTWLGNDEKVQILGDGQIYESDSNYLQGPWYNHVGEEVLPDKYAPIKMYGIGVLFPEITSTDAGLEINESSEIQENEDSDDAIDNKDLLESIQTSSELDDSDVPLESTFRPRSFALSIRTPDIKNKMRIVLMGGVYKTISVTRLGVTETWWERHSVETEIVFQSNDENIKLKIEDLDLSVGIESTKQVDGSVIKTIWVRNDSFCDDLTILSKFALYQTKLRIYTDNVLEYDNRTNTEPDSLALLYSDKARRSVGHGCDSKETYLKSEAVWVIESESFPVFEARTTSPDISDDGKFYELSMHGLGIWSLQSTSEVERMIENYDKWINQLSTNSENLPNYFTSVAHEHISQCKEFLSRMKSGWNLLQDNIYVRQTFMDASIAMANQRTSTNIPIRNLIFGENEEITVEGNEILRNSETLSGKWRPFQMAFILANIENVVHQYPDQDQKIDVIWMPTGGGKTEAYLGLAAFTILWERRTAPELDAGLSDKTYTKVLMRYTLRLLTSQQVSRAASLICALEIIRRNSTMVYGTRPVRIGAWLGGDTTPNSREDAKEKYRKILNDPSGEPGFLLNKCPWCSTKLGEKVKDKITGYEKKPLPNDPKIIRVISKCENPVCEFANELPVFEVDEDIYQSPPDFLIGTIDKFARLAWQFDEKKKVDTNSAQRILGLTNGIRNLPAPRLFIQDELHLISGPLGSIDALYEIALEALCRIDGYYKGKTPIIVASTATTKNFNSQLHALYGRTGQLVPPPGLTIEDSFFARVEREKPGKLYVGICTGGNSGFLRNQGKVVALLSHAAAVLRNASETSDPWWSNIAFFSSRRSLGQLDSLVETDLKSALFQIRNLSGVSSAELDQDGRQLGSRQMRNKRQLTAISSDDVGAVLEDLNIGNANSNSIDLCFATSMIEVGLDVPRLGLMTIVGQPKSASQYIQVSGRVGRSENAPGLVISLLNPNVYRDRSHYENFTSWHDRMYSSVEPASVTPFTKRSLQRTLSSILTILIRILSNSNKVREGLDSHWDHSLAVIAQRARVFDEKSLINLQEVADNLLSKARADVNINAQWHAVEKSNQFIFDPGAVIDNDKTHTSWKVLNSMRSVDADAGVQFSSEIFGRGVRKSVVNLGSDLGEL